MPSKKSTLQLPDHSESEPDELDELLEELLLLDAEEDGLRLLRFLLFLLRLRFFLLFLFLSFLRELAYFFSTASACCTFSISLTSAGNRQGLSTCDVLDCLT